MATVLRDAAQYGDIATIQQMHDEGTDMNCADVVRNMQIAAIKLKHGVICKLDTITRTATHRSSKPCSTARSDLVQFPSPLKDKNIYHHRLRTKT